MSAELPELLSHHRAVQDFEHALGDPRHPENVFSYKRAMDDDELEAFPQSGADELDRQRLFEYFIPADLGGKLQSFEENMLIFRALTRRDPTLSLGYMLPLAACLPIWCFGSDAHKQRLARLLRNKQALALGLTERHHGSDIGSTDVSAVEVANGFELTGEKWLVGNTTRGAGFSLFTSTTHADGRKSYSLLFVEKSDLDPKSYTYVPKIKTQGVRGADVSGIMFDKAFVPRHALVGPLGMGLEQTLKSLPVGRAMVGASSLGAADTALSVALRFAQTRMLYGNNVLAIPFPRRLLTNAFLDIAICECVMLPTVRSLHVCPEQNTLRASIAKYFVPVTIENVFTTLSRVLGARCYVRQEHEWGIFQKLWRDNLLYAIGEGNTAVILDAIASELCTAPPGSENPNTAHLDALRMRLPAACRLEPRLPRFDPKRLRYVVIGPERDDMVQGLRLSFDAFMKSDTSGIAPEILERIKVGVGVIQTQLEHHRAALKGARKPGRNKSYELFELAEMYCGLHAAAACFQMWKHNRDLLGEFFANGEWLALCFDRLLGKYQPSAARPPAQLYENVLSHVLKLYESGRLISLLPFELARPAAPPTS